MYCNSTKPAPLKRYHLSRLLYIILKSDIRAPAYAEGNTACGYQPLSCRVIFMRLILAIYVFPRH